MDAHNWWGSLLVLVLVVSFYDGTSSSTVPLTNSEKSTLGNCMSAINSELDQIMTDNKDMLCAIYERTQTKLLKTRMNIGTETSNVATEQDDLGCSSGQPPALTNEQLIQRAQELGDRLANMKTSTTNGALQTAMSCARTSLPDREDIESIIAKKFNEITQRVLKFGHEACIGKWVRPLSFFFNR